MESVELLEGAPTHEIPGDLDSTQGGIDCPADLAVTGSILDLATVCAGGSIRVGGAIEAAHVQCKGDLVVEGGIVGRQKGLCKTGGEVSAKYLSDACVEAQGNVRIAGDISNSKVTSAGMIDASQGTIQGGSLIANGGICCAVLGAVAGTPTLVAAGIDQALRQRATADLARLEELHARAMKIQETVGPLMQNPKRLTAAQKEKATELLYQASEIQQQFGPELARLERELAQSAAAGRCEIRVEKLLQPGVVVQFAGVKATVDCATTGPVLLTVRQLGREKRILLHNIETKSSFELTTYPVADDCTLLIARMIEKLKSPPQG